MTRDDAPAPVDEPVLTMAAPLPGDDVKVEKAQRKSKRALSGPNRLVIDELGVNAPLETTGAKSNGELSIPLDASKVTRYDASSALGSETGVTIVTGHVTNGSQKGALYPLASIEVGETVETFDGNGAQRLWRVVAVKTYDPNELPEDIFTRTGGRQLVIVTCGGEVTTDSKGRRRYEKNVLVFAEPLAGDSVTGQGGPSREKGLAQAKHTRAA